MGDVLETILRLDRMADFIDKQDGSGHWSSQRVRLEVLSYKDHLTSNFRHEHFEAECEQLEMKEGEGLLMDMLYPGGRQK
ncbi:MAG: hypothetical protein KDC54_24795 [Lewinella sp.]|nr:hypothetical protein [Lewinella sp.]